MAIPLLIEVDSLALRDSSATLRFTRRRGLRRRHNPYVDAAWWPRSANLTTELGHLLQVARTAGFQATAVAYRLADGATAPVGDVTFGGRKVKVSGYHNHHRDMITLVNGVSRERLQVMVVPPETPAPMARRALRIAAVHADPIQGTDLLALARAKAPIATVTE